MRRVSCLNDCRLCREWADASLLFDERGAFDGPFKEWYAMAAQNDYTYVQVDLEGEQKRVL